MKREAQIFACKRFNADKPYDPGDLVCRQCTDCSLDVKREINLKRRKKGERK